MPHTDSNPGSRQNECSIDYFKSDKRDSSDGFFHRLYKTSAPCISLNSKAFLLLAIIQEGDQT